MGKKTKNKKTKKLQSLFLNFELTDFHSSQEGEEETSHLGNLPTSLHSYGPSCLLSVYQGVYLMPRLSVVHDCHPLHQRLRQKNQKCYVILSYIIIDWHLGYTWNSASKPKSCKYLHACTYVCGLYFFVLDGSSKVENFMRREQNNRIYGILAYGYCFQIFPNSTFPLIFISIDK